MSTAVIFPGQGSQSIGMGLDFFNSFDRSKSIFLKSDEVLGYKLTDIIFNGSDEKLRLTENTQPALLAVSTVIWDIISTRIEPSFFAGHSLGEYTAIAAAGGLSFTDALLTVHNRGKFMQNATPVGVGMMMAVLGMEDETIIEVCRSVSDADFIVEPANFNCDGQVVVAGHLSLQEKFTEAAKSAGAKRIIPLSVSAPFHCSLMNPAKAKMKTYLESVKIDDISIPIVNNIDAKIVNRAEDILDGIIRQISGAVRWSSSVRVMIEKGVTRFIEVGAGSVLTGLVKKIDKNVEVFNISAVEDLKKLD